ncbi:MAG: hypothetical protein WBD31_25550 [Rubripirellula sp.]
MTETELLVDCLRRLETAVIDYMLVGSMAGNYWGVPRSTHDIDFVVEYDETQVNAIVEAFQDDFFIQQISVASGLRPPHQFKALDNRSALKVDFFRLTGDQYEFERFRRRKRVTLFDQNAWIATAEDVLLHKLRWHTISPTDRQLTDARGIYLVSGDELDQDYLMHWAEQIGVVELLQSVLEG